MRAASALLLLVAAAAAAPRTLDDFFRGQVVNVRGNRVTLRYDFDEKSQFEDFEPIRPSIVTPKGSEAVVDEGTLWLRGSCAVRHRAVVTGRAEALFRVRLEKKSNVGTLWVEPQLSDSYRVLNLFDFRLRSDGALRFCALGLALDEKMREETPLNSREVFQAAAENIGKRVTLSKSVEVAVTHDGWTETCRVGSLHRFGSAEGRGEPMAAVQFGLWVHESEARFDEIELTFDLAPEFLARHDLVAAVRGPAEMTEWREGKLARLILEAPLSADAAHARRELSRRGPDGWKQLVSVVRKLARKRAYAAAPYVDALANGDEPGRREFLLEVHERVKLDEIRMRVLFGLLAWYPQDAELVHTGLKMASKDRLPLLRTLAHRGLPDEILRGLTEDELLSEEAFELLQARASSLEGASVRRLAYLRARAAHDPSAALDFRKTFAKTPDWKLVAELMKLLSAEEPEIARGAYLLLLTISGKEIAPDADLWRSWVAAKSGAYEPPDLATSGIIAAAVARGRDFLLEDLAEDGVCIWPTNPDWPGCRVGATALAVTALRVAGVPSDHPALENAVRTTLVQISNSGAPVLRGDMDRYTYALTMLSIALAKLDRKRFLEPLRILARRIGEGQLDNGQWSYHCIAKGGYAGERRRAPAGDNSNTQYAILALRAARRAGVEVPREIWDRCGKWWLASVNDLGGWGYGGKNTSLHEMSMTAAGIATLSICAEALHGNDAGTLLRHDARITVGHRRLGELLLTHGFAGEEIYCLYGVERACVLTGVRAFNDFDWYREGARILVKAQKGNGAWGNPHARGVTTGRGYGEAVDTAYAILFLKLATTAIPGAGEGNTIKIRKIRKRREPK